MAEVAKVKGDQEQGIFLFALSLHEVSSSQEYDIELRTEKYLSTIKAPVMILHAKDDQRIDIHLGETLYKKTTSDPMTKSPYIRFIRMHEDYGVKHYTAKYPVIRQLVRDFILEVAKIKGDQEHGSKNRFELIDI
uniref:lysophosphatidylserine lipase ABHD12-like isoform X2 n=1 Tax=Styela clava TaxID=7725 RepID=UPI001939DE9B|nr:lysophosphatidylserine lipase ABHD12-like isoform X2 [Styela clava]